MVRLRRHQIQSFGFQFFFYLSYINFFRSWREQPHVYTHPRRWHRLPTGLFRRETPPDSKTDSKQAKQHFTPTEKNLHLPSSNKRRNNNYNRQEQGYTHSKVLSLVGQANCKHIDCFVCSASGVSTGSTTTDCSKSISTSTEQYIKAFYTTRQRQLYSDQKKQRSAKRK